MAVFWHGSHKNIKDTLEPCLTYEFGKPEKYVFAVKSKNLAMAFINRKIDGYGTFTSFNGIVITEQYKNDLEKRYLNCNGYLYKIIDTENCFHKHPKSIFGSEYICNKPVKIAKKYYFKNMLDMLKKHIKVIRYKTEANYVCKLYKNDDIISFDKYHNMKLKLCPKNKAILFNGKHYLYTTLEQAVVSIVIGPFVVPIFCNNKVMLFSHTPKKYAMPKKLKPITIKIHSIKNKKKLRQNIYYESNNKPIGNIKLESKHVKHILNKIHFPNKISKFIENV